jgi:hypothetical protein
LIDGRSKDPFFGLLPWGPGRKEPPGRGFLCSNISCDGDRVAKIIQKALGIESGELHLPEE